MFRGWEVARKDFRFEWREVCQRAFEELRSKLSTYSVLGPPVWDKLFYVFCDASNVTIGSALCQSTRKKGKDQPIVYARLLYSFSHLRPINMSLSSLNVCMCIYNHIGYEFNLCPHLYSTPDNIFDHKQ